MKLVTVTCDGCGCDLSTRTNVEDYRLVLRSESKLGSGSGVYTLMAISPPIDREHHFCGVGCLDHWRDHKRLFGRLMKERWDAWIAAHERKSADGRMSSYPSPPNEERENWAKECQEAASKGFPLDRSAPNTIP